MPRDMTKEGIGEVVHEIDVGLMGINVQGNGIVGWRYKTVNISKDTRPVVGLGININLFLLFVPEYKCMKCSHASTFKLEVVHIEFGMCVKFVEDRLGNRCTSNLAAEFYCIEIHKIKNIRHLNLIQIYCQRVL